MYQSYALELYIYISYITNISTYHKYILDIELSIEYFHKVYEDLTVECIFKLKHDSIQI